ncbi:response regulator transcription factor [Oceanirhabdus seepicola]|uniref:Stage 0 sporulation protein A homolog n=1 Tax=Oceanirhabdus seepicola TaxID=2828781 RepID=A0A9J6P6Q0_9CLOT|nr:response regulator transcription factor [Oceanirhabdus seepicola]MCM1992423.1 response regulator transcription factor [Oceanirhabdus seepicola]
MKNRILIIDDDIELCQLLKKCIEKEGMIAELSHTGASGLNRLAENKYFLLILDIMLPDMSGFAVLSELRKSNAVPVLMLTAKNEEVDKVKGLWIGADDYLTKPFRINEFMARVNSLIRRYTMLNYFDKQTAVRLQLKDMSIDKETRTVFISRKQIKLTGKEFELLNFLASNKGKIYTKKQIYKHVWEDDYCFDDNNIMSFISKLRKKIESDPNNPFYIQTVRGIGYRFNQEA